MPNTEKIQCERPHSDYEQGRHEEVETADTVTKPVGLRHDVDEGSYAKPGLSDACKAGYQQICGWLDMKFTLWD